MTWDQKFIDHLSKHGTLSESTINQHASRLRSFASWMRENAIPVGNIERIRIYGLPAASDSKIVRAYFDDIADKHPADFRQHIKTALRHYYSFLIIEGTIKAAPDLEIPVRKNGRDKGKQVDVLTAKDVATLRVYFKDEHCSGIIFEILVQLGCRKSELLMLRYSDFHFDANQVIIRSIKTEGKSKYGGARTMPLSPSLAEQVKDYYESGIEHIANDPLIQVSGHNVWEIIKNAGHALGMPWLTPHKFRHYCITKFSQLVGSDGITPVFNWKELSTMFGVSPEVIAQRYDHPSPENIVSKALKSGVYSDE